jgi:L-lysine 2,3-aminomutase
MALLSEEELFDIEVVGNVLPFKVNNYVLDELIDWTNYQDDPIYRLTFPHRDMLKPENYERMAGVLRHTADKMEIRKIANEIRLQLNPHPAGQLELNVPEIEGVKLTGVQHKYRETVLFFPSSGQTCHSSPAWTNSNSPCGKRNCSCATSNNTRKRLTCSSPAVTR